MARSLIALAVGLAVLCCLLFGLFKRVERARYLRPRVEFTLPLKGRNGATTMQSASGRVYGPMSFAVRQDSVAVLEQASALVLIFHAGYATPKEVALGRRDGVDIALGAGGQVFWLSADGSVYRGRERLFEIPRAASELVQGERIAVTRLGAVYVQVLRLGTEADAQELWSWHPGHAPKLVGRSVHSFALGPGAQLYWSNGHEVFGPSGRALAKTSAEIVGVDRFGDVALAQGTPGQARRIWLLGRPRVLHEKSASSGVALNVGARLAPDGDIYIARMRNGHYELMRLRRMTYKVFAPRFW